MQTNAISPQADHSAGSEHAPVPEQPTTARRSAALGWVVICLAATLVACHASFWLAYFNAVQFPIRTEITFHLSNVAAGAVGGLLLGAIQLLVVRRTGIGPGPWLLVSSVGGALGGVACSLYVLGMWLSAASHMPEWLARVLLFVVPGGLWAGLVGATQLSAFRGRLTRRAPWAMALLTMILTGSAVSLGHGILVVERALNSIEF